MKKVLVITYYWPPGGGAGVQRWLKFVKYLPDFGWEPVVYVPENAQYPVVDEELSKDVRKDTRIIRRPIWEPFHLYRLFTRRKKGESMATSFTSEVESNRTREDIANFIRSNFFIPDARKFWVRPSIRYLSQYLVKHPVDAVVTTGPPHSMHLIGLELQRRLGIKWLADFRDPWTNVDYFSELKLTGPARRKHQRLERNVLRSADHLVCVGEHCAKELEELGARKVEVITNGFDAEDTRMGAPARDAHFSLAHTGVLARHRNPATLWKALAELLDEVPGLREDLRLVLIGQVDVEVNQSIRNHGLEAFTEKTGYLPHSRAVSYQQKSQVLLLPINRTPNAKGILTGKFFEYMASGRPILVVGPTDGEVARVLRDTGSGLVAGFDDLETLKKHVLSYYRAFKDGKLESATGNIERYSRRELTRKLGRALDQLTV